MVYRPTQFTTNVTPLRAEGTDNALGAASPFQRVGLPQFKQGRRPVRRARIRIMSDRRAFMLSLITHITAPILLGVLTVAVMLMMGMHLEDLFLHAKPKPRDLEFVLVPDTTPEQKPLDPNTRYRAHRNSRAGGEHRPDRPLNLDKQAQNSTPSVAATPVPPAPIVPTPVPAVMHPQQTVKPNPTFTAPIAQSSAKPSQAKAEPMAASSSQPQQAASSAALQSVNQFNPQAGNNLASPGVDAIRVPDFGPYMKELQIRIKQSWHPPRNSESKQVVVVFHVKADGSLETAEVSKTSGEPMADQAALAAISEVFPFRPLPEEFADEGIDIQFTFDYNVFGDKQRLRRRLDNG